MTHLSLGAFCQTAQSAHMSVATTSNMSIDARKLLAKSNCMYGKAKLKIILRAKGKATTRGICFLYAL
jgi:hypothetical protein